MHRQSATPGRWNFQSEGVILIEQTPAPIMVLTAADTDIQTLAIARLKLPSTFGAFRVVNLLHLQQQISIDTYAETVLASAQVIILRLLGGRAYWSYGLEVLKALVSSHQGTLIVLPGDDRPDPELMSHSTLPLTVVHQVWRYFVEGGVENYANALCFVSDHCLATSYHPVSPQIVPRTGLYHPSSLADIVDCDQVQTQAQTQSQTQLQGDRARVGLLFYRAHYLSGNIAPIDALCQALVNKNLTPVPVFVSSLRDQEVQAEVLNYFQPQAQEPVQLILNTTSFAIRKLEAISSSVLLTHLQVPVFQVILSSSTVEQWEQNLQGLTARDVAMNVALPEVDGRIITKAVSFKQAQTWNDQLETDVVVYQPVGDRIDFITNLAKNWVRLRQVPPHQKRIALILANYPTRDGRLANGVGLDTPASCVQILKALQTAGYSLADIPSTGDELISRLTSGVTNDPEARDLRKRYQKLDLSEYLQYFNSLPRKNQAALIQRWGDPEQQTELIISGIQLGNVFVGIQPARGYDLDPSLNYHAPDLEPTHQYLAFYYWLRTKFAADAIVHVGKHGNLEWLPGKSTALSAECYPEIALGAIPHFYPFIVNDPGEGSQAKRRSQAVIIDHLTPPMTRAELYGHLQQLEGLIDEYYHAQSLDPTKLGIIQESILSLTTQTQLNQELKITSKTDFEFSEFLAQTDGYLCELKEAQIRDGLHIFGQCPQQEQLRDLIIAISRTRPQGITRALALDWGLEFDPLTLEGEKTPAEIRKTLEKLESYAAWLVTEILASNFNSVVTTQGKYTQLELNWIHSFLLPALQQTSQEIDYLLTGLAGGFVPSAPAGAPTRGKFDVLPTGRNFYSVDIRSIPTETAWSVGRKAAERLIEHYTQEHGEYPQSLALSVWGTSTMRTGGDDIAEALALIGVKPVWDGISRRVVDFEILPISALGRPRVDVTLRISGFFRDAFPNVIDLFDSAVKAVAALSESEFENPLASRVQRETQDWRNLGLSEEQAQMQSQFRIFGSKPGAYGAGLQGLIESQNWTTDADLAQAYLNWSSYAYTKTTGSAEITNYSAPEAFAQRLTNLQIVLHNQDNREHDLLDSDDYYQFQGGLTVAVRALTGKNPQTYFGDHSVPENPKLRPLKAEIAKVYRSRVINPKWITGVMRHGYKGAFELSATVDYLFAYDATANCVEDYMYQGVAEAYIFDEQVQHFVQTKNPWALRDMAERLLEAHQRGLWQNIDANTVEKLKAIANQAEAKIEESLPIYHSS